MTAIVLSVFVLLLLIGMPIAFVLVIASFFGMVAMGNNLSMIPQMFVGGVQSYTLMAVPLFLLAGSLMNESGTTDRMFRFARALVGHVPGGLAHVNILASLVFSGMSGSAVADSSGLGMIEIKAMKDQGYDGPFSAAVTAASSTIGPIFPPSIPLLLFGGLANVSVARLFLGGMLPAILMTIAMMILVSIIAKRRNYPKDQIASPRELLMSFKDAILALFMPGIILGGILLGIFTATEAAAVASGYALFLGFFVYKTLHIRSLPKIFGEVAASTAIVMLIIAATTPFRWIIAFERIPEAIYLFLSQLTQSPVVLLLILNVVFLLLGCVMENTAIIILSVPILMPVIVNFGIDPVHFGVMMILNLMIGLITPPVGLCLFTTCSIAEVSLSQVIKEVRSFFLVLVLVLITITLVPNFVLWLPNALLPAL